MNYKLLLGLFIVNNLVTTGETNWELALLCVTLVYVYLNWKTVLIMIKIFPRDVSVILRTIKLISVLRKIINNNDSVVTGFHRVLNKGPKKVCFYFEDQVWSYQDVEDYSNRIANIFLNAGFKKGDTVALLMGNCPEYVSTWLGLAKLGICTAFINTNLRQKSLAHCVNIVTPKAIIYTDEFVEAINDVSELLENSLQKYHFHGKSINESISLPSVSKDFPNVPDPPGYKDQLLYIYTSGTTGLPKAAKIPHLKYYIFANAVLYMTNMTEDDIIYDPLPMYHSSGGALAIGPALLMGNPVVLRTKFSATTYFTDCIKYKCTIGFYIGEMCRYIMNTPPRPTDRQHKVRIMFGAGMNPWIWSKFVERFGVGVVELYGSTEGTVSVGNVTAKVGSIGFLPRWLPKSIIPMAIIKYDEDLGTPIRDEKGFCIRCEFGEPGMFIGMAVQDDPVKRFHGYVDTVASNSKLIHNVFKQGDTAYVSGDLVVMDEEGYIYFKDRTGDTFRWKGENVSTTEVESVISDIIGFRECTVYGVKVGILEGRAGMAAIADPDNEVDLTRLATGLEAALPSYAQPLFIRIMTNIPKTGTYKLRKLDLRDEGFNPSVITDKLYFHKKSTYVPIDTDLYEEIMSGKIRL